MKFGKYAMVFGALVIFGAISAQAGEKPVTRLGSPQRVDQVIEKLCDVQEETDPICDSFAITWNIIESLDEAPFCDQSITITAALEITQPGSYCLINDIAGTVTISANRVFLNLNEKCISNPSGNGVSITTQSDIVVRSGIIKDAALANNAGVLISGGTNVLIEGITFNQNDFGVSAQNSACIQIKNCVFDDQGADGIRFETVTDSQILNSKIRGSGTEGVDLEDSSGNKIEGNLVSGSSSDGIILRGSSRNSICKNRSINNNNGIVLSFLVQGSDNNQLIANEVRNNASSGILLLGASNNVIQNNMCLNNQGSTSFGGIRLLFGLGSTQSINNLVIGNICNTNVGPGIFLDDISPGNVEKNLVIENSCSFNSTDGIEITGDDNTILRNTTNQNTMNGILNAGSGNKIFNNFANGNAMANFSSVQPEVQGIQPTNCRYICNHDLNETFTITQAGTYCLAEDVTGNIRIAADEVILDLNERRLITTSTGITVAPGFENIEIKNGFVDSSGLIGIFIESCTNVNVSQIDFAGGGERGVSILTATCIQVHDCTLRNFTVEAIRLNSSDGSRIFANKIEQNNRGILLDNGSQNNLISSNYILESNTEAVSLSATSSNIIEKNKCLGGIIGIDLFSSSVNTVQENNCSNNATDGIRITTSNGNLIRANICNNNNGGDDPIGICAISSSNNQFIKNSCNDNGLQGISLFTADNSLLCGNSCSGNGAQGFLLNPTSDNNQAIDNKSTHNTTFGIQNLGSNNKIFNNYAFENGTDYDDVPVEVQGVKPTNCRYICAADLSPTLTIVESGIYCLTEDAIGQITIDSDDVVLDLNNHVLTEGIDALAAVRINSTGVRKNNIVVKNGTIRSGLEGAVYIALSTNVEISDLTMDSIASAGIDGVFVAFGNPGAEGIIVKNCSIRNFTSSGVNFSNVNEGQISNCSFFNTGTAVNLRNGSAHCVVAHNLINNNDLGIVVDASGPIDVRSNNCINNTGAGIFVSGLFGDIVLEENICMANGNGIFVTGGGDRCVINKNICNDNTGYGIQLIDADNHIITENITAFNSFDGINVNLSADDSADNFIASNIANLNGEDGISIDTTTTNDVFNNIALDNGSDDYVGIAGALAVAPLGAPTQGSNLKTS